jgi:acetyl esterase/lipase
MMWNGRLATMAMVVLVSGGAARAGEVEVVSGLAYKGGEGLSEYEAARCRLDLYLPAGAKAFPTLVWFHGGGLTAGERDKKETVGIARGLASCDLAVASVGYRLSPKAQFPAYVQDAAASFAWIKAHIAGHGGDPERVFIGGHSAGGYLALMVALDPRFLRECGLEPSAIAGAIPVSGQTMTHYTVRKERGLGKYTITADEAAPVYHARKDTPPMLVLYADRDMPAREAENEYLVEILKATGNKRVQGLLIRDRDHGSVAHRMAEDGDPAREAILGFVRGGDSATMW